jgi:Cu(I)/Ag(I) efflux system membrane fusion protein
MEMSEIASSITNTETLEDQRELFKTLSEHLIEGLENTGSDQPIYVQYCPMAFDNEGASWISLSDEILNPYFGDQMLHCGSVLKIIE